MRVSAVSFLNAAPLARGLREDTLRPQGWEVAFDPPSRCAERLLSGDADLGLVPSLALGLDPALRMAAPLCIAAEGEVTSVLLFCGGDVKALREVALDPASRTSQMLLKVLLSEGYGIAPLYEEVAGWPERLKPHQGVLAIGDRALLPPQHIATARRVDLAAEWYRQTELPFVFALWACHSPETRDAARETLLNAYAWGAGRLADLAREAAGDLGLPARRLEEYLRHHLHYTFSEPEARGLRLFLQKASGEEIADGRLDIQR